MSEEEKLAREGIQQVCSWLGKKSAEREETSPPRLAIKFCGGCNPQFERGEVVRRIRESFPTCQWVSWEEESDLILIVNGCPAACADRGEIQKSARASLVIRPGGISPIGKGGGLDPMGRS